MKYVAAMECGGQSFKLAISKAEDPACFVAGPVVLPNTNNPAENVANAVKWLKEQEKQFPFDSLGIASFGPVDLMPNSATYGYITTTPKKAWQYFNLVGEVKKAFPADFPIFFDTDVNAPALAEQLSNNVSSASYITVGTGVGVGFSVNGQCLHGLQHPEMGHVLTPLHPRDVELGFAGACPFHCGCIEGMTASNSLISRLKLRIEKNSMPPQLEDLSKLEELPDSDETWEIVSHYLAYLCHSIFSSVCPEIIVVGGGIFNREILLEKIREKVVAINNGYISKVNKESIGKLIVKSKHQKHSGIVGALFCAKSLV